MIAALPDLDPATYAPHWLHGPNRVWTETNCYVDAWIEVLHSIGCEPAAAGASAFSADFDGVSWRLLKYPLEELRALFGVDVYELNMWQPLHVHLEDQLARGRLCTVEVDAFYLPDTAGTTYREAHDKTTIVPERIDLGSRRLGYFHNASYFVLEDDDFDGVMRLHPAETSLPPYAEVISLEAAPIDEEQTAAIAMALLAEHVRRAPEINPVLTMQAAIEERLPVMRARGIEHFHLYAFNTLRQCGAGAEIGASFLEWLMSNGVGLSSETPKLLRRVAESTKTAQFLLARAAAGRTVELGDVFSEMRTDWADAMEGLRQRG